MERGQDVALGAYMVPGFLVQEVADKAAGG